MKLFREQLNVFLTKAVYRLRKWLAFPLSLGQAAFV